MEGSDLEQPLNPTPLPSGPPAPPNTRRLPFLFLLVLTAVSVYFGYQVTSGDPVCDEPLSMWVYGYLTLLLILCPLSASRLSTSPYSHNLAQVQITVSIGMLGWMGYGLWLVYSSEECNEELRRYVVVVLVPVCVLVTLFAVVGGLYLCAMQLLKCVFSALLQGKR